MIQILVSLATFTAFAAAVTGLGSVILPGALLSRRFAAGTIGLFIPLAVAGWLGLFSGAVLWGILICCMILFLHRVRTVTLPGGFLWLVAGLAILLPLALLPPFSRDAMNHHLFLPKLWLFSGRIVRPGWASFFSYPYMVETFYTLAGGTLGFAGARMISFLGFTACGIALLEMTEYRRVVRILSLVVFFSIPEMLRNGTWAFADSFAVFFSLMAFLELIRDKGNPIYAVIWAGAAALCKYNCLLILATTMVLLPLRFGFRMKRKALAIGAALFLCAWWAVPNLVEWGNPVYPLMKGIFGPSETLSEHASTLLSEARMFTTTGTGIADYALLPIRLSVAGRWDDPRLFDGASGPLLLAGLLLFILLCRRRREYLLLPSLFLCSAVLLNGPGIRVRYLLPGLAMLALPAALGLQAVSERMKPWITLTLTGICIVWTGVRVAELYSIERPWMLLDEGSYLAKRVEYIPFYLEADTVLDMDDLTLFVNMGNRAFYFPSRVIFDEYRFPLILLERLWGGAGSDELAGALEADGIRYVAMHMGYSSVNIPYELSDAEMEIWREFMAVHMKPVISMNPFVLFELI
jgi:hypothetical protein